MSDKGSVGAARGSPKPRWGVVKGSKRVHFFDPPPVAAVSPDRWVSRCDRYIPKHQPPLPEKRLPTCYSCILRTTREEQTMPHFVSGVAAGGPHET